MSPYPHVATDEDFRIGSQRPREAVFVTPTSEEIALADEMHDIKRANSWMPFLLPLVPLLIAVAVHLYFR